MDYKQHYIRKGDVIVCTPYMPGRCAKLWDKPEVFDPERPALDRTKQTPHFGYGPHRCIGEKIAKIEILTLLEVILQQAILQTNDTLPELLETFTLRPEREVKVTFSKRSNCF